MSRVGKKPIAIPAGVKASINAGVVLVEGPKGKLSFSPARGVAVSVEGATLVVKAADSAADRQVKANHGTARASLNNMVAGVATGWKRSLELNGVGFGAKVQGQSLVLSVGFSHDVTIEVPKGIKCTVNKNVIDLESADREAVGTLAAKIRKVWPPEPYLGKGIKYAEETIRRKAGKTGKK